tara:strand:+ start:965 stop:3793 length:2829 start_codon:yes stop_codon:yes gene_type:complete
METRIEIYKDELWQSLRLATDGAIKYNAVINKIGKVSSREISHTNTFTLPHVQQNLQILGLNKFNPAAMAQAMNAKYIAKYYVEDKLLQEGYLVINNTNGGQIKVNFIEESLSLTAKWGSTTFRELLRDDLIEFPADYQIAIDELRNYNMDVNAVLTPLANVGTRGHNLCLFPNNLNAIGDEFQIDQNDLRQDDVFNPYQSRPIFNMKALFDLATESFGYTPIYDDSVDWDSVENLYIVDEGGDQNEKGENGIQSVIWPTISSNNPHYTRYDATFGWYQYSAVFNFPTAQSVKPNDIPGWVDPLVLESLNPFGSTGEPWMSEQSVFVPILEAGNVGTIQFIADYNSTSQVENIYLHNIYKNPTPGGDVVIDTTFIFVTSTSNNAPAGITIGTTYAVDITIDKTFYNTVPAGTGDFIGVMVQYGRSFVQPGQSGSLTNMIVLEDYLPEGVIAFDEFGQFLPSDPDLSFAASNTSIKSLLSNSMHQQGILMDINTKNKTVKFFNYGEYEQQRVDGYFGDWSNYLLRHHDFMHNTDYGNNYAKQNRIGLTDAYLGNAYDLILENQGEDSKYKDFQIDSVSAFKDVEQVIEVNNTTTPYFEYTNMGLGLVEHTGSLGTLEQERADGTSQGSFTGLAAVANVNYIDIPDGVKLWYKLVDEAVRVEAKLLLPVDEIKDIDMSQPIYLEELGGFYIIEEIREYTNGQTPVVVKLIKLLDDYRGLEQQAINFPAQLSLSTTETGIGFGSIYYKIFATVNYLYYTPTQGATVTYTKLTDSIANGGVPSGLVITGTVPFVAPYTNQQNNIQSSAPITTAEEGWYEVVVEDTVQGITSNTAYAYLGDNSPPPAATVSVTPTFPQGTSTVGDEEFIFIYANHTALPTSSVFSYQRYDFINQVALGSVQTVSFPTNVTSGTQIVTFIDGPGFYQVTLTTNEAASQPQALGGYFIS